MVVSRGLERDPFSTNTCREPAFPNLGLEEVNRNPDLHVVTSYLPVGSTR